MSTNAPVEPPQIPAQDAALRRGRIVLAVALLAAAAGVYALARPYPIGGWLALRLAAIWAYTALFSIASASFGLLVLERVFRRTALPALETAVTSMALGVIAFALAMMAAGALHLFRPALSLALPAAMIAVSARHAAASIGARLRDARREPPPPLSVAARIALAFGVIGALFVYLGALTPEAINFDASWFHLALAADYARLGGIVAFPADYMRSVPHLASLLYTWAFLVPGLHDEPLRWMLAQHLEIALFFWTLAGVGAAVRWLLGDAGPGPRGAWALFFLFPSIFVYDQNLGAAADHVLAFFAPPLLLAALRAGDDAAPRKAVLAGVLAGGALLTKYQAVELLAGVFLAFALRFFALARARRAASAPLTSLLAGPSLALAVFALIVAPHFLFNVVFHRNPLYPFAQDLFPGSSPRVPSGSFLVDHLMKDERSMPHGPLLARIASSLRLVLTYAFEPHYAFTRRFATSGPLFTLTLPLLLFVRGRPRIGLATAAGLGALFAWAMTLRVDRNLQTFLPILVIAAAAVLARAWELGGSARIGVGMLLAVGALGAVDAAFYNARDRLRSAFDLIARGYDAEGRPGPLADRSDYRALGASLPPSAKILMHNWRPNLGIDRDVLFDMPGQQGLIDYDPLASPGALVALWRGLGATHMVHRPGLRPAQTKQVEVLVAEVTRAARKQRFGALELVEIPAEMPPSPGPYLVLCLGLDGYPNGLYPVEAMTTNETLVPDLQQFPAPTSPWWSGPEAAEKILGRARAVILGREEALPPAARSIVDRDFATERAYEDFTLLLRRAPAEAR